MSLYATRRNCEKVDPIKNYEFYLSIIAILFNKIIIREHVAIKAGWDIYREPGNQVPMKSYR